MADKTQTKPPEAPNGSDPRLGSPDEPIPIDAQLTDTDLNRFQTYAVPQDVRKKWISAKLPSLDPGVLEDTVPPNAAPAVQTPDFDPDLTQPAMHRRRPVASRAPERSKHLDQGNLEIAQRPPDHRRRRAVIAVLVVLFLALALGAFALLGQDKGVAASRTSPSATEANEPHVASPVEEQHQPAVLTPSTKPVASGSGAPDKTRDSPPAASSSDAVRASVSASSNPKPVPRPLIEDAKPPAPSQPVPSAKPVVTPPVLGPAAPGGLFDRVPARPAE